jgi:hypothetical protein
MATMHRHRRVAILQRVRHEAEFPPLVLAAERRRDRIDAGLQRIDCRRFDSIDVILHRIDLRQRRKAGEVGAVPVHHDGRRGERVIEQAQVRAAGLDRARGRIREVAEAGIGPIDVGKRLAKLAPQVRRGDIEFPARGVHERPSPPERRQTSARVGDAVDQGPRVSGARAELRPDRNGADAQRRVFEERPASRHARPPSGRSLSTELRIHDQKYWPTNEAAATPNSAFSNLRRMSRQPPLLSTVAAIDVRLYGASTICDSASPRAPWPSPEERRLDKG